jgi:hypothetical protein
MEAKYSSKEASNSSFIPVSSSEASSLGVMGGVSLNDTLFLFAVVVVAAVDFFGVAFVRVLAKESKSSSVIPIEKKCKYLTNKFY